MEIKDILINDSCTVLQAMELLDKNAKKILFIHMDERLEASLTDGDIRRWILKGGSLNAPVKNAANYSPKYLRSERREEIFGYMKTHSIDALPIVDDRKKIINIVFKNDRDAFLNREKINIPVVMMAGGLGTRLYPYTKILPKPLIPVGDIPIAELIINRFRRLGCNKFYLIVNHKKNMIKAYFNEIDKNYDIEYIDEKNSLGTGGGLSLLKGKINREFILTNCDILVTEDFAKIYRQHRDNCNDITVICSLKNFTVPYGVVEIGDNGEIEDMREKPQMSFFTNTGCYIVEPHIIDSLQMNKAVDFPEIIEKCREKGKKIGVYPIGENDWMDMGQPEELEKMRERLETYEQ
ncbi:MAG: NTP transferase domain-containing protein [Oscillospiraceae bacterium]|nr:NTP transferase domain-containing protein [Oscillospiraceae bacterium]